MADGAFKVQVEHDHLRKLANTTPVQAVAELVWNALDANATRVDVNVESGDLSMRSITVIYNGHGFSRQEAKALFGKVGGSWKRIDARSKNKGRALHGKEGKGRFRVQSARPRSCGGLERPVSR